MLPVQSQGVARSETAITTRDLNQILQPNAEQSARVVNSRQDPVSPTLFRVALEVGNQRLEVMTNRPLAEGLTVLLSRDARGDVALRLPTPVPAQPTPAQTQALNQLGSQANQFIAMIAPESRAQAQQLLTQTQMMAMVQPQVSNLVPAAANPLAGRAQTATPTAAQTAPPTTPSANQATSATTSTATTSAAGPPQQGGSAGQTLQPGGQGNLATGSAAAASAAANQAPIEAIRAIQGNAGQGQQGQQARNAATNSPQPGNQSANPSGTQASANPQTTGQTGTGAAVTSQPNPPNLASAQTAGGQSQVQNQPASTLSPSTTQAGATGTAQTGVGNQQSGQLSTSANTAGSTATSANPTQPTANQNSTGTQPQTQSPTQTQAQSKAAAQLQSQAQQSAPIQPQPTQTGITLARVVDGIDPKMSPPAFARATLNLGGETLNLVTPRPLLAGQQVEVTRLSDMAVQVRILPPAAAKTLPPEVVEEMQALLRQAMPTQAPLADSLNQMRALSAGQGQDAVGQIVRSLMGLFSLSPQSGSEAQAKQVEQMMQQSGLFTENRMARQASGAPMSVEDLRTRLGQLRRAAQELPTQAREQMNALIDRAEARATHQQIHSARQWRDYPDGTAERYFRMDLPLQTPEGFKQVELELKEQRRPISPTETQTNWTLNLHFDLDPIGAVDARVHLEDEWNMSISFWAESLRTTEMIRDRIDGFSAHLQQQGFEIDSINVRKGRAPNDLAPPLSKHLVDVHT